MHILEIIIREAGLSDKDYPHASLIPVNIFDRKNRPVTDPDLHFKEPLFILNEQSKRRFAEMLNRLEAKPVAELTITIDENQVIIHGAEPCYKRFSRCRPADINAIILDIS